ncbi:MAG: hypothetical protein ACI4RT_02230 [Candidatus Spyradenecus sp.]
MAMQETNILPKKDNLFSATQIMPVVPDKLTIAQASAVLVRGSIVTAAGALATAAADAYAILAEDCDSTVTAKEAPVYLTGEFNEDALTVGDAITVADCKVPLRKLGIFIKKNIPA